MHLISPHEVLTRRYDIVQHASSTNRNVAAALLGKVRSLGRCRHLFTANLEVTPDNGHYRQFVASLKFADRVVAVSEAVKRSVENDFGRKVDWIVPNGFDAEFFDPAVAVPGPEGSGYFLWVGIIEERKRPDVLIELARRCPDQRFLAVGRQAEWDRDWLGEMRGVENCVHLGAVDRKRLRELLAGARGFIFPSEREGLPLSVIEAVGMGVPAVVQPKSSMPEIVEEGRNGWLRDAADLDGWVDRVQFLANMDDAEWKACSARARESAVGRYSWDRVADGYREVYERTVE
ncbi:MAG: glycosyltransferase family 4 protein [Akkermansiaceae bacterium]|nr:glycosyltransferase family 4 protein [Akkermansiaceae bacterium]